MNTSESGTVLLQNDIANLVWMWIVNIDGLVIFVAFQGEDLADLRQEEQYTIFIRGIIIN